MAFVVEQVPNKNDVTELVTDFDKDGREDRLIWLPQTAGSSVPADYASATLILAVDERPLVLEEAFVSVLQYKRRYYVATTSLADEKQARTNSVYSIGRNGFKRVCTFTTRLREKR